MGLNIGNIVGDILPFDPTPGFNLGRSGGKPQIDASGTTTPLGGKVVSTSSSKSSGQTAGVGQAGTAPVTETPANTSSVLNGGADSNSGGSSAAYGLYGTQANDALSRALASWSAQQQAIGNQYNTNLNELDSSKNAAQNNYNQSSTQNLGTRVTNENTARDQANNDYTSLMSILASIGAGGGSVARELLPQLVQGSFSKNLNGVQQNYATNQQSLDTNWNNYLTQDDNQRKQLNDWRSGQLAQDQAQYNQTRQSLLDILGAINSRADTAANLGSQVQSINAQIPNTVAVTPTYNGTTPVYQAPTLQSYESTPSQLAATTNLAGTTSSTPWLDYLASQKDQNNLVTA